jgi:hypothetical protein
MTQINIHKSKFLVHLLTNILEGLLLLGKHDPAIKDIHQKINWFLTAPEVDGEQLVDILMKARDIVDSYDVEPDGDEPIEKDTVANLPGYLFNAIEELDLLITTERVKSKGSIKNKIEAIKEKLNAFEKIAGRPTQHQYTNRLQDILLRELKKYSNSSKQLDTGKPYRIGDVFEFGSTALLRDAGGMSGADRTRIQKLHVYAFDPDTNYKTSTSATINVWPDLSIHIDASSDFPHELLSLIEDAKQQAYQHYYPTPTGI